MTPMDPIDIPPRTDAEKDARSKLARAMFEDIVGANSGAEVLRVIDRHVRKFEQAALLRGLEVAAKHWGVHPARADITELAVRVADPLPDPKN